MNLSVAQKLIQSPLVQEDFRKLKPGDEIGLSIDQTRSA
jgi:hypothetical protein